MCLLGQFISDLDKSPLSGPWRGPPPCNTVRTGRGEMGWVRENQVKSKTVCRVWALAPVGSGVWQGEAWLDLGEPGKRKRSRRANDPEEGGSWKRQEAQPEPRGRSPCPLEDPGSLYEAPALMWVPFCLHHSPWTTYLIMVKLGSRGELNSPQHIINLFINVTLIEESQCSLAFGNYN